MAQKSEEITPKPDAIIRLRRNRLLGANLNGSDVNFCWMILIRKYDEFSPLPPPPPPPPLTSTSFTAQLTETKGL